MKYTLQYIMEYALQYIMEYTLQYIMEYTLQYIMEYTLQYIMEYTLQYIMEYTLQYIMEYDLSFLLTPFTLTAVNSCSVGHRCIFHGIVRFISALKMPFFLSSRVLVESHPYHLAVFVYIIYPYIRIDHPNFLFACEML